MDGEAVERQIAVLLAEVKVMHDNLDRSFSSMFRLMALFTPVVVTVYSGMMSLDKGDTAASAWLPVALAALLGFVVVAGNHLWAGAYSCMAYRGLLQAKLYQLTGVDVPSYFRFMCMGKHCSDHNAAHLALCFPIYLLLLVGSLRAALDRDGWWPAFLVSIAILCVVASSAITMRQIASCHAELRTPPGDG